MKKITSLLCFFLLALTMFSFSFAAAADSSQFKDLGNLPQEQKVKFDELISSGVFSGLSDDTFGLDAQMDRAQFAKVASLIFSLSVDKTLTSSTFNDVPSDHWSLTYVEALKKAGLTNGYDSEGKTYNPSGAVSRQELAAFLIRGIGLDDAAKKATPVTDSTVDDWAKGYVALALEKNILTKLDDGSFGGKAPATRKMLALASFESKKLFAEVKKPAETPGTQPATPTPAPTTPSKGGDVSAKGKKAIITSDVNTGNAKLRDEEKPVVSRLESLGFEVTRLASTKITAEAVEGYDLVVIGTSTNSKYVQKKLKGLKAPIIYIKSISFGDADFSKISEKSDILKQTTVTIQNSDHPLAAGLKGDVQVFYEPAALSYGFPSGDGKIIVASKDDPAKGIIIGYEKGSKNILNEPVAARTVLFGLKDDAVMKEYATDELWKLFDASALWCIQNP
ncbi:S-layer homology domain-containing protein [Paenibacillus rigui]|uniref:S-layer protein n=1 Tax=Paenibacillus rigui TaxID=554312 RepID=A0A229UXJ3_9BACL|nr:S-layer homology domain-containing protein [Paenibacillus rigui]OXM87961.1 S-layer protein [Paenibacillus rigui]